MEVLLECGLAFKGVVALARSTSLYTGKSKLIFAVKTHPAFWVIPSWKEEAEAPLCHSNIGAWDCLHNPSLKPGKEGRCKENKQWTTEILSSLSPQIMLSTIGGAESKKQQTLERESIYKLNTNSIFGTFPSSFSVSCVLSAGLQPIWLWQHNSLQDCILNWIRDLIRLKKKILPRNVSSVMGTSDCENNWNQHCHWTRCVRKPQPHLHGQPGQAALHCSDLQKNLPLEAGFFFYLFCFK